MGLFKRRDAYGELLPRLHDSIVSAARRAEFHRAGVPDTLDGRFELLVLHLWLVLRRLKEVAPDLGQRLFEYSFTVLDLNVREMGVGDLGVGKRVKAMGRAYYGRTEAYEAGLAGGDLHGALSRNLFGTLPEAPSGAVTQPFVDYVRATALELALRPKEKFLEGTVSFPDFLGRI